MSDKNAYEVGRNMCLFFVKQLINFIIMTKTMFINLELNLAFFVSLQEKLGLFQTFGYAFFLFQSNNTQPRSLDTYILRKVRLGNDK